MIPAVEALRRLEEGNRRFVEQTPFLVQRCDAARRAELVSGQSPFAIVIGCSDARVPAEIVFDQGLGDLFVVRVAGNVVAPSQLASVELAAERFGTRLVVVLGHSQCGAVVATLEELRRPPGERSERMRAIVDRVRPAAEPVLEGADRLGAPEILARVVRANVRNAADHVRHGSRVLERLQAEDGLRVVGAEYALETGAVEFFDGVPLD